MTPEIFSCKVFSLPFSKQIQSISTANVANLILTTKIEELFMCIHMEARNDHHHGFEPLEVSRLSHENVAISVLITIAYTCLYYALKWLPGRKD